MLAPAISLWKMEHAVESPVCPNFVLLEASTT